MRNLVKNVSRKDKYVHTHRHKSEYQKLHLSKNWIFHNRWIMPITLKQVHHCWNSPIFTHLINTRHAYKIPQNTHRSSLNARPNKCFSLSKKRDVTKCSSSHVVSFGCTQTCKPVNYFSDRFQIITSKIGGKLSDKKVCCKNYTRKCSKYYASAYRIQGLHEGQQFALIQVCDRWICSGHTWMTRSRWWLSSKITWARRSSMSAAFKHTPCLSTYQPCCIGREYSCLQLVAIKQRWLPSSVTTIQQTAIFRVTS